MGGSQGEKTGDVEWNERQKSDAVALAKLVYAFHASDYDVQASKAKRVFADHGHTSPNGHKELMAKRAKKLLDSLNISLDS
jgi:hypothetical protein